eukprot:CAMPEP_0175935744 /NCGR_PEP_ID=MMETSP0108-20121206/21218_1 /TAXON_ID=195067 ORGANISM="Goniomonas pacifica, Strain CCMP1869" /NCGR_SAMPLE_ID=MMETSP0108 /ASSEMBLY_ACC=CAM_ASM_000204 /LENGTH=225 /DNA_ID=CAMNT_0017259733 /DNA_START=10 /DNA_END=687 /DNA_ORIENTATION=-
MNAIRPFKHEDRGNLKDRIKSACLEKIRQRRMEIVLRNRSDLVPAMLGGVGELVREEARTIAFEARGGDVVMEDPDFLEGDDVLVLPQEQYEEVMQFLEAAVQQEMKEAEAEILKQQEEAEKFEQERSSAQALAHLAAPSGLLCPVCRQSNLAQHLSSVFCRCGLRLDLKTDLLDLTQVGSLLSEAYIAHREACAHEPACAVQSQWGPQLLVMHCATCAFFKVIV